MRLIPFTSIVDFFTYGRPSPSLFIIPATDGSATIASHRGGYMAGQAFHDWGLDKPGDASPEMRARLILLESGGMPHEALSAITTHHFNVALTQHQIAVYLATHIPFFRHTGYSLLLPFVANTHIWFALAIFHQESGLVRVNPLSLNHSCLFPPNEYLFVVKDTLHS